MLSSRMVCFARGILRANPRECSTYHLLQDALSQHPEVAVAKVQGAGRGLVASSFLSMGTPVLQEQPILCSSLFELDSKVCHHCLQVLALSDKDSVSRVHSKPFCSRTCAATASGTYLKVAGRDAFADLETWCASHEELYPLLAMRAACEHLAWHQSQARHRLTDSVGQPGSSAHPRSLQGLGLLCHANVGEPPPLQWQESYLLLKQGIGAFLGRLPRQGAARLAHAAAQLDLGWYTQLLARVHINSFNVQCVMPPEGRSLLELAAAAAGGLPSQKAGTAVYFLASLVNHDCEPNLDVLFPDNNARLELRAARDINKHEQLTISYLDQGMSLQARQRHLQWAYGFRCDCSRCRCESALQL